MPERGDERKWRGLSERKADLLEEIQEQNRLSYSLLPSQLSQYLPMARQSGSGRLGPVSTRHADWCPGPGNIKGHGLGPSIAQMSSAFSPLGFRHLGPYRITIIFTTALKPLLFSHSHLLLAFRNIKSSFALSPYRKLGFSFRKVIWTLSLRIPQMAQLNSHNYFF